MKERKRKLKPFVMPMVYALAFTALVLSLSVVDTIQNKKVSKADFIHKMTISLKEANETEYWLMLLHDSDFLEEKIFKSMLNDCQELIKMLISIIKSSKENHKKQ